MVNDMYIEPCPHCGGISYLDSEYNFRYRTYFVYVKCETCGAQGTTYSSKDNPLAVDWDNAACIGAIASWNMRTPLP